MSTKPEKKPLDPNKASFQTGDVARALNVCPRTAAKLIDAGSFGTKGVDWWTDAKTSEKTHNSPARKVSRAALIRFLKENKMPLGVFAPSKVIVLSADSTLFGQNSSLSKTLQFELHEQSFSAGAAIDFLTRAVIWDCRCEDHSKLNAVTDFLRGRGIQLLVIHAPAELSVQISGAQVWEGEADWTEVARLLSTPFEASEPEAEPVRRAA